MRFVVLGGIGGTTTDDTTRSGRQREEADPEHQSQSRDASLPDAGRPTTTGAPAVSTSSVPSTSDDRDSVGSTSDVPPRNCSRGTPVQSANDKCFGGHPGTNMDLVGVGCPLESSFLLQFDRCS